MLKPYGQTNVSLSVRDPEASLAFYPTGPSPV